MVEVKKWTATYTKQINKKAKVYHDGFLELHSLRRKVTLYDDCQNVLDSRFIEKDYLIESGETLAFGSFLVDIGDLHGDVKPSTNVNVLPKGTSVAQKYEPFQSPVIDRKPNLGKQKARSRNLSPSQKIIREFKRSEVSKHSYSPASLDTTKSSKREWQVLYTTQITQKAKKYHDGFLQLLICGSKGNKVMLYDATRVLLDSRFLKNDEVIRSGESVSFDGHLVDIGECKEDHEKPVKLNCPGTDHNLSKEKEAEAAYDHIYSPNESPVEWEVTYTTQLTQKTKNYNIGTLKLAASGSYYNQVILLSDEGTMLSRRYLRSSENLRTGSTLQVQNYLVELGEPRASPKVFQNIGSSLKARDSSVGCSNLDNIRPSKSIPTNGPARGALEILSILKKPKIQNDLAEGVYASWPCHSYQSGTTNQIEPECGQGFFHAGSEVADLNGENTKTNYQSNATAQSEAVIGVPVIEISIPQSGEIQTGSSGFSDGSGSISKHETCINTAKTSPTSSDLSVMKPKVLAELEFSLEVRQQITPMSEASSTEVKQIGVYSEHISSADGRQIEARWGSGVNLTHMATSNKQDISTEDTDAFPSFELGF